MQLPGQVFVSAIVTAGSGRPYNILAGIRSERRRKRRRVSAGSSEARARQIRNPVLDEIWALLPAQATTDVRVSRRFSLNGMRSVEADFRGVQSV